MASAVFVGSLPRGSPPLRYGSGDGQVTQWPGARDQPWATPERSLRSEQAGRRPKSEQPESHPKVRVKPYGQKSQFLGRATSRYPLPEPQRGTSEGEQAGRRPNQNKPELTPHARVKPYGQTSRSVPDHKNRSPLPRAEITYGQKGSSGTRPPGSVFGGR